MNGIICIDKPEGFTSFDIVAKCRGILGTRKLGHGGTLDPMATGVLPLFAGRATKACDILPNQDKRYTAAFRLGLVTDTQDITGLVLEENRVTASKERVEDALRGFVGACEQIPPMYSAVRVGGQRLYDLARQGRVVEREPRPVTFYSIDLLSWEGHGSAVIDVRCSKGTYIRTLCHDIGRNLGCGATMTALRRTEAGSFTIQDCITLEDAQALRDKYRIEERLIPVDSVFAGYPCLVLTDKQSKMFSDGVRLSLLRLGLRDDDGIFAVYNRNSEFLGIAAAEPGTDDLVMIKWFGAR